MSNRLLVYVSGVAHLNGGNAPDLSAGPWADCNSGELVGPSGCALLAFTNLLKVIQLCSNVFRSSR
jgi:hypothetical protein